MEWRGIEEKIYHTFCNLNSPTARPIWLWEYFKLEKYAIYSHNYPLEIVDRIVESREKVWLMLNESAAGKELLRRYFPSNGPPEGILVELGRGDKFWFYEGEIEAIQKVLFDSGYIDEIYIVSKKYEWLLCINHHDVLYATGGNMPAKLRQLEAAMKG
jgi:hypothetical protein